MPKLIDSKIPSYRQHKRSGQAIVTLNGADCYLGTYNSVASKVEYNRRISEWIAAGRQRPTPQADLSISELIKRYKVHCETYYRRADGSSTGETGNIGHALKPLRLLYGNTPAADFSPLKLKAVREAMIDPTMIDPKSTSVGWCRNLVNQNVHRIRAMFRWAEENELLPVTKDGEGKIQPAVFGRLKAVTALKQNRTEAREAEPILPVSDLVVENTLPHLTSVVSAMVRFQRLTGARPGEACQLRTGDIDRTEPVWNYKPAQHKTQHHGRDRVIAIGPKAQAVLMPFLKPLNPTAYIFSPADAMAEVRDRRQSARKTPLSCGNRPGTNITRKPKRLPGDRYNAGSYRRAIDRACDLAFPAPADLDAKARAQWHRDHRWAPNQLRHSMATAVRKQFGLEGAQVVLSHASADITQIYAERDQAAASRIASEVG